MSETTRIRVSMPDFVRAWQGSENVQEVADKTGLTITSAQARASKYRAPEFETDDDDNVILDEETGEATLVRGPIPLKSMSKGGGVKLEVDEAIKLIAELEGVSVETIQARADKLGEKKVARQLAKVTDDDDGDDDSDD